MNCQNFTPSPALRPYIEEYSLLQSLSDQIYPENLPPGGRSGLLVNVGNDCLFTSGGVSYALPSVAIGGQMTHNMQLAQQANCQILMITFRTTAIYRLFNLPMADLTDQVVDIEALFPLRFRQQWRSLTDQLRETTLIQDRIRLIERHLLAYIYPMPRYQRNWVDEAATWLSQPGNRRVQQLSGQLGVSPRHLTRAFTGQVGISPKRFAQVMRFRNMFRLAYTTDGLCWHDLVHLGGWYDQAHFCNDLHQITGLTPSAFFTQQHAITEMLISNHD